jgi:hypothetical protein
VRNATRSGPSAPPRPRALVTGVAAEGWELSNQTLAGWLAGWRGGGFVRHSAFMKEANLIDKSSECGCILSCPVHTEESPEWRVGGPRTETRGAQKKKQKKRSSNPFTPTQGGCSVRVAQACFACVRAPKSKSKPRERHHPSGLLLPPVRTVPYRRDIGISSFVPGPGRPEEAILCLVISILFMRMTTQRGGRFCMEL